MKNLFAFLTVFLSTLVACTKDCIDGELYDIKDFPTIYPSADTDISYILNKDTLRILSLGNSYTEDYTKYIADISESFHDDTRTFCQYNVIRSSASFYTWYKSIKGTDPTPCYCQRAIGNYEQDIPTGNFPVCDSTLMKEILSRKWDLIILQQASSYANNYNSWNSYRESGYLYQLVSELKARQSQAAFAFVLIHSYAGGYKANSERSSMARWRNIASSATSLSQDYPIFQLIIPCGTAIENLRTSQYNNSLNITRDGIHLGYGLACMTAGLTFYQTVFAQRTHNDLSNCPLRHQCSERELGIGNKTSHINVTDENIPIAISAATSACNNPFDITYTSIN